MDIFYINKSTFRNESNWIKSTLRAVDARFRSDWVIVVSRDKKEKNKPLRFTLENKRNKTRCYIDHDSDKVVLTFFKRKLPDISVELIPTWSQTVTKTFEHNPSNQKEVEKLIHDHLCSHTRYSLNTQEKISLSKNKDLFCKKILTIQDINESLLITFDDNTSIDIPKQNQLVINPSKFLLFKKDLGYQTVCQLEKPHFFSH